MCSIKDFSTVVPTGNAIQKFAATYTQISPTVHRANANTYIRAAGEHIQQHLVTRRTIKAVLHLRMCTEYLAIY